MKSKVVHNAIVAAAIACIACLPACQEARAQQSMGTPGLIHVPTADMDTVTRARIGAHFVNKEMIPDRIKIDGKKFNSATNYLSITPFRWFEVCYGYTLWKFHRNKDPKQRIGFYAKDRYFSARVQPVREAKWWPSLVVGGNDVWGSGEEGHSGSNFYRNYYVAATKHFELGGQKIGGHLAYRKWYRDYNRKWDGVVGGITVNPSFYRQLRLIAEWDGTEVNVGADCLLFNHFLLQASLQRGRYFSGGLCYVIDLN